MKHTPGPWTYEGGDNSSCEVNIGETTACITRYEKNTGVNVIERNEMEANGKLIAAAPDLLEAVSQIMQSLNKSSCGWNTDSSIEYAYQICANAYKKATE